MTVRPVSALRASAARDSASATRLRRRRLPGYGIAWPRPTMLIVISSRERLGDAIGRFRTPAISMGSGRAPAGPMSARAARARALSARSWALVDSARATRESSCASEEPSPARFDVGCAASLVVRTTIRNAAPASTRGCRGRCETKDMSMRDGVRSVTRPAPSYLASAALPLARLDRTVGDARCQLSSCRRTTPVAEGYRGR